MSEYKSYRIDKHLNDLLSNDKDYYVTTTYSTFRKSIMELIGTTDDGINVFQIYYSNKKSQRKYIMKKQLFETYVSYASNIDLSFIGTMISKGEASELDVVMWKGNTYISIELIGMIKDSKIGLPNIPKNQLYNQVMTIINKNYYHENNITTSLPYPKSETKSNNHITVTNKEEVYQKIFDLYGFIYPEQQLINIVDKTLEFAMVSGQNMEYKKYKDLYNELNKVFEKFNSSKEV